MKHTHWLAGCSALVTSVCIFAAGAQGCGGRSADPSAVPGPGETGASGNGSADPGLDFGLAEDDASGTPTGGAGVTTGSSEAPPLTVGNTFTGTGCVNGNTACTNCIDDDGDGLIDAFDPECTGPLDDDEATFATGIPGDNVDFCQDCFFDGNSGQGDDGCQYHTECLYGRTPNVPSRAACFQCEVSDTCRDNCAGFTPNGCDCFGCCEVFDASGQSKNVLLSESCSLATLNDEGACEACVPTLDCYNDCGPCEICIGRTALGPECGAGGDPTPACPSGNSACNEASPCPGTQYCLTGCCIEPPVIR